MELPACFGEQRAGCALLVWLCAQRSVPQLPLCLACRGAAQRRGHSRSYRQHEAARRLSQGGGTTTPAQATADRDTRPAGVRGTLCAAADRAHTRPLPATAVTGGRQPAEPRGSGLSGAADTAATLARPPCPYLRGWQPGLEPAERFGPLGGLR